jgi:hypothetical protein
MLMAVMMSWSMSWRHCSTAYGEVCGRGGLLSSCRAPTSVTSVAATEGGVATVLAVYWHCGVTMAAVATVRLPARRDCPTLEQEVASPSAPHSW